MVPCRTGSTQNHHLPVVPKRTPPDAGCPGKLDGHRWTEIHIDIHIQTAEHKAVTLVFWNSLNFLGRVYGGRGRNRTYNLSAKSCREAIYCRCLRSPMMCSCLVFMRGSASESITPDCRSLLTGVLGIFAGSGPQFFDDRPTLVRIKIITTSASTAATSTIRK
jgi:hypothetical protein